MIIIGLWVICDVIPAIFLVGDRVVGCDPLVLSDSEFSFGSIDLSLIPVIGRKSTVMITIVTTSLGVVFINTVLCLCFIQILLQLFNSYAEGISIKLDTTTYSYVLYMFMTVNVIPLS